MRREFQRKASVNAKSCTSWYFSRYFTLKLKIYMIIWKTYPLKFDWTYNEDDTVPFALLWQSPLEYACCSLLPLNTVTLSLYTISVSFLGAVPTHSLLQKYSRTTHLRSAFWVVFSLKRPKNWRCFPFVSIKAHLQFGRGDAKAIFFSDLCHCRMLTLNWILYDPSGSDITFVFTRNINPYNIWPYKRGSTVKIIGSTVKICGLTKEVPL